MSRPNQSSAEQALTTCLQDVQQHIAKTWRGREKEALIALVRALDSVSAASFWERSLPRSLEVANRRENRAFALMGAAPALRPLLSVVNGQDGGVPFGPNDPYVANFWYRYLLECGELTFLRRMAALERYGLATTEKLKPDHLRIETVGSAPEQALLAALRNVSKRRRSASQSTISNERWNEIHERMSGYVDTQFGWFIRYDNDWEVVSAYREEARNYGLGFHEAEAFPDDVMIGDRSFGEWKESCEHALGRILAHMDFAVLLQQKIPKIALSNVLTLFARREDVNAVWVEAGLRQQRVASTMKALSLQIDGLDDWELAYEAPASFYVDLGSDFVLMPCFGALTNPYFALFRHLRRTYKRDWDRGVDRREAVFRSDLAKAFPEPRFMVPLRDYALRRIDRSLVTDVDAVIIDKRNGTVVLAQLKWHDVYGFSLAERESRKKNIAKANQWVERVLGWVGERSSAEVLRELKIDAPGSDSPPILYVVGRYAARFAGDSDQDCRASWLSWLEIQHVLEDALNGPDPLGMIPDAVLMHQKKFETDPSEEMEFQFRGLKVTLQMRVTPETP